MKNKLNYVINLTFIGYFIILFVERALSIIMTIVNAGFDGLFSTGFSRHGFALTIVSLVAFLVYFFINCRDSLKKICKPDTDVDFKKLSIASGIILVSGMVHTENTIAGIQFASYGVLIAGLLLKFIQLAKVENNKVDLWLCFAYLVAFSMAIPVTYESHMESAVLFHAFEAVTAVALVGIYIYFAVTLFNDDYHKIFNVPFFFITLVLDVVLIAWRFAEEINYFVLVALSIAVLLYLVALILRLTKRIKK